MGLLHTLYPCRYFIRTGHWLRAPIQCIYNKPVPHGTNSHSKLSDVLIPVIPTIATNPMLPSTTNSFSAFLYDNTIVYFDTTCDKSFCCVTLIRKIQSCYIVTRTSVIVCFMRRIGKTISAFFSKIFNSVSNLINIKK